jgi:hypothetical protein
MTKHRRTRRSQKGGSWLDALNPFGSSEQTQEVSVVNYSEPGMLDNLSNSVSGAVSGAVSTTENYLQGAKEKSTSWLSSLNPFSSDQVTQTETNYYNPQQATYGGRRRSKSRKMRGGRSNLGLTYYATNVSNDGLKVVTPTYWIKGGSKRHRRGSKHRRTHRKRN